MDGSCANDVETEQVISDFTTRRWRSGSVLAFVQLRASVPLFWAQHAGRMEFKPPILFHRKTDVALSATRRHFADLFERYGSPLIVVNLMRERGAARAPGGPPVLSDEARLSAEMEEAV